MEIEIELTRDEKHSVRTALRASIESSPLIVIKKIVIQDPSGAAAQEIELILCWYGYWRDRGSAKGYEGIVSASDAGRIVSSLNELGVKAYYSESYK